jgi:ubiquinone/menaquinone biosynthesis C-methylase UbiE
MSTGMADYEEAASGRKAKLFRSLLASLPRKDAVVAEVGMGSFPNAPYFVQQGAPTGLDIVGIDPNDKMARYAQSNARRARLTGKPKMTPTGPSASNTLRIVHGVSEALPFEDASCDAVICTLTLCSVLDPAASLAEIKRVLKPGGKFLFWEHVLSETDADLARRQIALTPNQVLGPLQNPAEPTETRAGFGNPKPWTLGPHKTQPCCADVLHSGETCRRVSSRPSNGQDDRGGESSTLKPTPLPGNPNPHTENAEPHRPLRTRNAYLYCYRGTRWLTTPCTQVR